MLGDEEFRQLLVRLDRPWAGFRKVRKGVRKRLGRHMQALNSAMVDDYLHKIEHSPELRAECEMLLTVSISRFFRDRQLWMHLQERILPAMMDRFPQGLAAWSAGCAGGEEPYTLAMIWEALNAALSPAPPLCVLATDMNPAGLQRAREGLYAPSSLKEAPPGIRQRWFETVRGGRLLRIDPHLQDHIGWQVHQLLDPPPEGPFHIILLRNNLLTYYQGARLQTAFTRIAGRLANGGILVLGSHERPPSSALRWMRDADCPWVYSQLRRKKEDES